jgi:flagellar basal-body rod protein FlgB
MSWLVDPAQRVLAAALDGLSTRNALIASNLANIDTPGYRPQSIDFESALQAAIAGQADGTATGEASTLQPPSFGPSASVGLRTSDPRHLAGETSDAAGQSVSPETFDGSLRNDANTVDLESEMTALVQTQLRFSAVSRLETGKLDMLRSVVGGR